MVRFAIDANTGGWLLSCTITLNVCAALIGGVPLSVTITVIEFVLGPWASVGVHEKIPLDAPIDAPAGALLRL